MVAETYVSRPHFFYTEHSEWPQINPIMIPPDNRMAGVDCSVNAQINQIKTARTWYLVIAEFMVLLWFVKLGCIENWMYQFLDGPPEQPYSSLF